MINIGFRIWIICNIVKHVFSDTKLIIDVDPGIDDAFAIFATFGCEDVDVIAITCPNGNANPHDGVKNVIRILTAANRTDIPVYKGSEYPLLGRYFFRGPSIFYGLDGFADIFSDDPPDMSPLKSEHAALALIKYVNDNPGEITIVALGPLTNIALASILDENFSSNVKELHILGGSMTGLGNEATVQEFNIIWDPEAANIVLQSMKCPIYVATWDLCIKYKINEDQITELTNIDSDSGRLVNKLHSESPDQIQTSASPFYLCDSLALVHAIAEDVAESTADWYTSVELCGELTRGEMIVDRANVNNLPPNVQFILSVNFNKVFDIVKNGIMMK